MLTLFEYFLVAILIAVNIVASNWLGQQTYSWMPVQATEEAQRVDALFSFLTSVGAFIFLGLLSVIIYSVIFFRAKPKDFSVGHPMRGNLQIEIAWMVVPTLLVLWISVQNIDIYNQLNILGLKQIAQFSLEEPANATERNNIPKPIDQKVEVTAKQWMWSFRYPNNVTSQELHLPVNQTTQLNLRSEDVIHGFYVPEFRIKQDIVPNRKIDLVITPNRKGQYRLKDSQFSGADFALMVADVYIESREDYEKWLLAAINQPEVATNSSLAMEPLINSGWWYTGSSTKSPITDRTHSPKGNS
ncbi:cytochrome c oxidase subunit II (plasmid) [Pseudanabaena biceps]|nr:cytochrome c oxidase subunit II [Pseudanabaena biceps]